MARRNGAVASACCPRQQRRARTTCCEPRPRAEGRQPRACRAGDAVGGLPQHREVLDLDHGDDEAEHQDDANRRHRMSGEARRTSACARSTGPAVSDEASSGSEPSQNAAHSACTGTAQRISCCGAAVAAWPVSANEARTIRLRRPPPADCLPCSSRGSAIRINISPVAATTRLCAIVDASAMRQAAVARPASEVPARWHPVTPSRTPAAKARRAPPRLTPRGTRCGANCATRHSASTPPARDKQRREKEPRRGAPRGGRIAARDSRACRDANSDAPPTENTIVPPIGCESIEITRNVTT